MHHLRTALPPRLRTFLTFVQTQVPVKVRYKNESLRMKILYFFIQIFVPRFMDHFTTTWGNTIYFPHRQALREQEEMYLRILAHETVHLLDSKRCTQIGFGLSYLFPQVIALGALGSLGGNLYCLLFLIFLLPWPAPFRFYWESRAYAVSMMARLDQKPHPQLFIKYFTGSEYYFMYPFPKRVSRKLRYWQRVTYAQKDPILRQVMDWYQLSLKNS